MSFKDLNRLIIYENGKIMYIFLKQYLYIILYNNNNKFVAFFIYFYHN